VADITIGDFHAVKESHPEFYDKRGISSVLVNTKKGLRFFEEMKEDFELIESTLEKHYQWMLHKPAPRHDFRNFALMGVRDEGYQVFKNKYLRPGIKSRLLSIYSRLPFSLQKSATKLFNFFR